VEHSQGTEAQEQGRVGRGGAESEKLETLELRAAEVVEIERCENEGISD